eukprot:COSAG02_NODE_27512_length_608_cov_0.575639_2_plen_59_part_01
MILETAATATLSSVCDGWRKVLMKIASCANRHKPGPGNIMQPPGTNRLEDRPVLEMNPW